MAVNGYLASFPERMRQSGAGYSEVRGRSGAVGVNVRVYPESAVPSHDPSTFFGDVQVVSGPLEAILRRADARGTGSLYDSDFCGSISFADWWYHYARELDLPLIRAIDDPGLVATGAALDDLEAELDRLEACWAGLDLSPKPPKTQIVPQPDGSYRNEEISFAEYLQQGALIVRKAIGIARERCGILVAG
jgi:hypothetical protein